MIVQMSFKCFCNVLSSNVCAMNWAKCCLCRELFVQGGHQRLLVEVVFAGEGPKVIVCPLSMQTECNVTF